MRPDQTRDVMAHSQQSDPVLVAHPEKWPGDETDPKATVKERITARLRHLESELRKTAIGIYRDSSTSRDIALGSMKAMVIEAQIEELEWVLSKMD